MIDAEFVFGGESSLCAVSKKSNLIKRKMRRCRDWGGRGEETKILTKVDISYIPNMMVHHVRNKEKKDYVPDQQRRPISENCS